METILAVTDSSQPETYSTEAQQVKLRAQNNAYLFVSSTDNVFDPDNNPADLVLGQNRGPLTRVLKRIALSDVKFYQNIDVINSTNNKLMVYVSSTKTIHTVYIPVGDHNTPQKLYIALKQALDTIGGLTIEYYFKGTPPPPPLQTITQDNMILLRVTSASPILFLSECSALQNGRSTYNFVRKDIPYNWDGLTNAPVTQTVITGYSSLGIPIVENLTDIYDRYCWTVSTIGPSPCCYSRYVDIFSSTLFRYCKNPSSSTRGLRGDLLYRLHLDIFEAYDTDPGVLTFSTWPVPANQILYRKPKKIFQETGLNMAHINLNPSENISNVAISLRDEYGNPYWSTYPQILDGTDVIEYDDFNNGIVYYLTFISEI